MLKGSFKINKTAIYNILICDVVCLKWHDDHAWLCTAAYLNASYIFVLNIYFFLFRAANWNLGEPTWTGRMRVVAKGVNVTLKLEDKVTGGLYANCPVETYPGNCNEKIYH